MVSDSAQVSATRPFYAADAEVYDLLVTDPVEPWVEIVDAHVAGSAPALIHEAGCGTGRHAAALAARGHHVELADASPELLRLAARRCPGSPAHLVDICRLAPDPRFDAVSCRGVLNDLVSDTERQAALLSMAGVLRPGGLPLLDVRDAARSHERADGTTSRTTVPLPGGGRLTFRSTATWSQGTILVREEHEVEPDDGPRRPVTVYDFVMRPWSREEIAERLARAGFEDLTIAPGVDARRPDRLLVTARRPDRLAGTPPLDSLARLIRVLQHHGLTRRWAAQGCWSRSVSPTTRTTGT